MQIYDQVTLNERDHAGVERAIKVIDNNDYKKALIIRGVAHYKTLEEEFLSRGYRQIK